MTHWARAMVRPVALATVTAGLVLGATTLAPRLTLACHARGALPDARCTPGAVLTTDRDVVCVPGYATSVRDVSDKTKRQVAQAYGVVFPAPTGSLEIDHLIPLTLGGSNDITNLWPEPASPIPGFHQKDALENMLHAEVCRGELPLTEAQHLMATDWLAAYQARIRG